MGTYDREEAKRKICSLVMSLQKEKDNCVTEYYKLKNDESLAAYNNAKKQLDHYLHFLHKFLGIFWKTNKEEKVIGVWNWGALED